MTAATLGVGAVLLAALWACVVVMLADDGPDADAGTGPRWGAMGRPPRATAESFVGACLAGLLALVATVRREPAVALVCYPACGWLVGRCARHVWRWRRPPVPDPPVPDPAGREALRGWQVGVITPAHARALDATLPGDDPLRPAVRQALRTGSPVIYERFGGRVQTLEDA